MLDRGSLYKGEYNRSSDEISDVPMTGSNNGKADVIADGMEMMIELLKVQSQVIRRYRCWHWRRLDDDFKDGIWSVKDGFDVRESEGSE